MSSEEDAKVAEFVMGETLDWYHQEYRELAKGYGGVNEGRGIYMRCRGCDIHGFANEVDWTQRCPTPPCTPYTTDVAADHLVLVKVRTGAVDSELFERFYRALWQIWADRQDRHARAMSRDISQGWGAMPTYYEPGDYARAALAAALEASGAKE